ncbi:MAG: hypothetical protein PUF62_07205 [Bacteroidales bacterium]|nr:hypothetical protein [Bacteroidales bacterium]
MSQLIMPTGFPRWIFHRKTPLEVNGTTDAGLQASVVGLYEKAIHVSALEDVEMITVFFYPYAIPIIMGIPFNHPEACATCWNEYIERMVKPVYMEGMNLYPIHSGQWLKVYYPYKDNPDYFPELSNQEPIQAGHLPPPYGVKMGREAARQVTSLCP